MSIYEVPNDDWERFCRWLVDCQRGGPITLRSIGGGQRSSTLARGTLHGLHLDREAPAPELCVVVAVEGRRRGEHGEEEEAFGLPALQRILFDRAAEGQPVTITAESECESPLILELEAPRDRASLESWH